LTGSAASPDRPAGAALGDGRFAVASFRPADVDELCRTVREQLALGHAIYPQGGKTALDYGGIPGRPGVAIDTTAISRLIDYPFADMTVTVEAGMTLSALSTILAGQKQRVLVDAPAPDRATLGGIYATNTSGPRRYGAGRPRDQIIGVSFVTSQGVVVKGGGRVVKNVAGYDFPKLMTGSMGALGIITQMTLKVRPIPEASALAWVTFPNWDSLALALEALNTSGTRPIALELLNAPAARALARTLGLRGAPGVLAIGYEDNAGAVRWQLDRLRAELGRSDIAVLEGAGAQPLWEALTELQAAELGPVGVVANVRPSSVVSFVGGLDPQRWSALAHAGNGIVRAHALGDWPLEPTVVEIERLRGLAVEDGGNLIVARAPSAWKERLRVWGEPRDDWAIGERVKAALDPHGAMNPGRFVGRMELIGSTVGGSLEP
jgi:glycolate oxidase FAD binding subunit